MIKTLFVENFQSEAFRISGDEFILLFNRNYLNQFKSQTTSFEKCAVSFVEPKTDKEKIFTVRVSFGIAFYNAGDDFQVLRNRAEMACKKAKTSTEQRFFVWTAELERSQTKEFRETCQKCETIIRCDVPDGKKEITKILRCPVCEHSFEVV